MARRRRASSRRRRVVISATRPGSRARSRSRSTVRRAVSVPRALATQAGQFRPKATFEQREARNTAPGGAPMVVNDRFGFRRTRGRRGGVTNLDLDPLVAAYIDPWSVQAEGIKYCDTFGGLSGTFSTVFEGIGTTAPATGTFTDLNQVAVVPTAGTFLRMYTPDPSNLEVNGIVGTPGTGFFAGVPNTFNWPNGILFTNAKDSLNTFGPGSGLIDNDTQIANIASLRSQYAGVRLVSGGIRYTSTQNYATVSGTFHIAPVFVNLTRETSNGSNNQGGIVNSTNAEMQNGWQCQLPANLSDMANIPGYASYPMSALETDEVVALFQRYSDTAKAFKPTSTSWGMNDNASGHLATGRVGDASMPDGYGHMCVVVYISGILTSTGTPPSASTVILETECKLNYEVMANAASSVMQNSISQVGAGGTMSRSPAYQPIRDAAADNLCHNVPPIRCIDDAGVEEASFIDEVIRLWGVATRVAGGVTSTISAVSTALAAFTI